MKKRSITKFFGFFLCLVMGICIFSLEARADERIYTVSVEGLDLPGAGKKPDFQVSVSDDANYKVQNYWGELYNNGILWQDITDSDSAVTMDKDDVFVSGHLYQIQMTIVADSGYYFGRTDTMLANIDKFEPYIKGNEEYLHLIVEFYVGDIDKVEIMDLEEPKAGCHPDYEVTIPEDAEYYVENMDGDGWINGMLWFDSEDNVIEPDDVFEAGKEYRVLIGIQPNDGYYFSGDGILKGTINDQEVEIYYPVFGIRLEGIYIASEEDKESVSFIDVKESDYFYKAVRWAVENSVTAGVGNNRFAPDDTCTRAQVVSFIHRSEGKPRVSTEKGLFTDVRYTDWFYESVLWAVENNITSGVGSNRFAPNDTCTRAQVVTFLWRNAGKPEPAGPNTFTDVPTGAYYEKAVTWAAENGIVYGTGKNQFSPNATCTRGQVVCFLQRHYDTK